MTCCNCERNALTCLGGSPLGVAKVAKNIIIEVAQLFFFIKCK